MWSGTAQCDVRTIKCEKKNNGITKYDKSAIKCDVGTAQCDNKTVKCEEKKIRIPSNVIKVQ